MTQQGEGSALLTEGSEVELAPQERSGENRLGRFALGFLFGGGLMIAAMAAAAHFADRVASFADSDGIMEANIVTRAHEDHHAHHAHKGNKSETPRCSWAQENCTTSQCCMRPGQQCFKQNDNTYFATCMDTCVPGPHPSHWDGEWWSCEALGKKTNGTSRCSKMGENCTASQCCEETNTQCFEKSKAWATCKSSCQPDAPDASDSDMDWWTCKTLGPWTPGAAPWLQEQCSAMDQDCRYTKCCNAPGLQCYEQNGDWASCRYDCLAGPNPDASWDPEWSCNEIGLRVPGNGPPPAGIVAEWVQQNCSWPADNCNSTRCCIGFNQQCYEKNVMWATCMESCEAGVHEFDSDNQSWSCKELGARSDGLAVKGNPSLYCWSLFQTTTYEMDVMKNQMSRGEGIFQCDDWALLSTDKPTVLGNTSEGQEAKTMQVEWAEITTSVDGTAGNAKLFINCWNVIVEDGRWNNHAWTVKADPDAVLLPDRLRVHLAPHKVENVYVVNCNKFPSSPNFPMMYGSLEIYSWKAIQTYANGMSQCMDQMAGMIPLWGEDYFMTHCLDAIGVGRLEDFASIGDNVCTGANCGDGWVAAFHPFKSVDEWQNCWDIAHR